MARLEQSPQRPPVLPHFAPSLIQRSSVRLGVPNEPLQHNVASNLSSFANSPLPPNMHQLTTLPFTIPAGRLSAPPQSVPIPLVVNRSVSACSSRDRLDRLDCSLTQLDRSSNAQRNFVHACQGPFLYPRGSNATLRESPSFHSTTRESPSFHSTTRRENFESASRQQSTQRAAVSPGSMNLTPTVRSGATVRSTSPGRERPLCGSLRRMMPPKQAKVIESPFQSPQPAYKKPTQSDGAFRVAETISASLPHAPPRVASTLSTTKNSPPRIAQPAFPFAAQSRPVVISRSSPMRLPTPLRSPPLSCASSTTAEGGFQFKANHPEVARVASGMTIQSSLGTQAPSRSVSVQGSRSPPRYLAQPRSTKIPFGQASTPLPRSRSEPPCRRKLEKELASTDTSQQLQPHNSKVVSPMVLAPRREEELPEQSREGPKEKTEAASNQRPMLRIQAQESRFAWQCVSLDESQYQMSQSPQLAKEAMLRPLAREPVAPVSAKSTQSEDIRQMTRSDVEHVVRQMTGHDKETQMSPTMRGVREDRAAHRGEIIASENQMELGSLWKSSQQHPDTILRSPQSPAPEIVLGESLQQPLVTSVGPGFTELPVVPREQLSPVQSLRQKYAGMRRARSPGSQNSSRPESPASQKQSLSPGMQRALSPQTPNASKKISAASQERGLSPVQLYPQNVIDRAERAEQNALYAEKVEVEKSANMLPEPQTQKKATPNTRKGAAVLLKGFRSGELGRLRDELEAKEATVQTVVKPGVIEEDACRKPANVALQMQLDVCVCGVAFPSDYSNFCRKCGAKRPELESQDLTSLQGKLSQPDDRFLVETTLTASGEIRPQDSPQEELQCAIDRLQVQGLPPHKECVGSHRETVEEPMSEPSPLEEVAFWPPALESIKPMEQVQENEAGLFDSAYGTYSGEYWASEASSSPILVLSSAIAHSAWNSEPPYPDEAGISSSSQIRQKFIAERMSGRSDEVFRESLSQPEPCSTEDPEDAVRSRGRSHSDVTADKFPTVVGDLRRSGMPRVARPVFLSEHGSGSFRVRKVRAWMGLGGSFMCSTSTIKRVRRTDMVTAVSDTQKLKDLLQSQKWQRARDISVAERLGLSKDQSQSDIRCSGNSIKHTMSSAVKDATYERILRLLAYHLETGHIAKAWESQASILSD